MALLRSTLRASFRSHARRGFNLTELVIACTIIGVLAAIVVPRVGYSTRTGGDTALTAHLAIFRTALDNYASDHNGAFPTAANFVNAMTQYSDAAGNISATRTATAIYGPYLSAIPALPIGRKKGGDLVSGSYQNSGKYGWIYSEATGTILPNTSDETDAAGKLYSSY
jgi:prepilin-type N-terminal cleavage/methylation domain-containing protein